MIKNKIKMNNIIVGAGPAGLQLAYYFEKYHIEYIILERNSTCGSLYETFPNSNELLSINKKNNNNEDEDFNLRYDWNTLLNDENFSFKEYSNNYYPSGDEYHRYLNDFSKKFNLKINYNECVRRISLNLQNKDNTLYEIETDLGIYTCNKVIIATGLSKPNIPDCKKYIRNQKNIKHCSEFGKDFFKNEDNLNHFKNKSVLLVGLGNSSLELSNILNNYCSHILITGKQRDLSVISHYDGDIRSKYMNFYDTFLLNGMNGIDNKVLTEKDVIIEDDKGQYFIMSNHEDGILFCNSIKFFDYIIYCTGKIFDSSIFDEKIKIEINNKYPKIRINYESFDNNNIFFIGSLMNGINYNVKNSYGFIKGYRQLIKLFFRNTYVRMNEILNFKFDGTYNIYNQLAYFMYERINNSSSLFNLPDYIVDIFYFDKETQEMKYYKDMIKFGFRKMMNHNDINDINNLCILKLVYGERVNDLKNNSIYNKFNPSLLHPEIEILIKNENNVFILKDKFIFEENLVSNFKDKENYYDKLVRTLKSCIFFT